MLSRSDRKTMMDFVEKSSADKKRDKAKGYREDSQMDLFEDNSQAKALVRGNKNQKPPKGWK